MGVFKRSFRRLKKRWNQRQALRAVGPKWQPRAGSPHELAGSLLISLTSYPPRFPSLHLTIRSLLSQTVKPDKIVLWIAWDDLEKLPAEVRALESKDFEVRGCDDLRNFKKILPALEAFPGWFIVIADDDTYYPEDWLKGLVDTYDPDQPSVVCYRGHRPAFTSEGRLAPYYEWEWNSIDELNSNLTRDLLATGVGGVLYPPGSLPPETSDLELVRKYSATSDDVWLFFMWRKNGWSIRRVPGPRRKFVSWPNSQKHALWDFHAKGTKDRHLQDMFDRFGWS